MTLQIHAKFNDSDAFAFEKFSLEQSMRSANEDFPAVADYAVPRNAFSRRSSRHGASGSARAARQAQSLSEGSIG